MDLYEKALSDCVYFELEQLPLLEIYGKDATRYLHGRLTQDIKSLKPNQTTKSMLLTPQGKILGKCLISCIEKKGEIAYIIVPELTQRELLSDFIKALLQFKVADQIEVTELRTHRILSIQGPRSTSILESLNLDIPKKKESLFSFLSKTETDRDLLAINNPRGTCTGFDLVIPDNYYLELKNKLDELKIPRASEETRTMLRISAKIPEFGQEINEKVTATEIEISELVSFNKGCYAGQEVVEMSTARGRPNKTLLLLASDGENLLSRESAITTDIEGKNLCGEICSSAYFSSKQKTLSLAFIKTSQIQNNAFYVNQAGKPIELQKQS
jgi:folate-binding protein YgfZ